MADLLFLSHLATFIILGFSMIVLWIYPSQLPGWYFNSSQGGNQIDESSYMLYYFSVPILWFCLVYPLQRVALNQVVNFLYLQMQTHGLLARGLGEQLLTGGDGRSFKLLLQQVARSLPGQFRELDLPREPPTRLFSRFTVGAAAVILAWLLYLHFTAGIFLEYPLICVVMLIMLLDYHRKLSRIVLDMAFAKLLLGSFELPEVGVAPPPPPPPPEHM